MTSIIPNCFNCGRKHGGRYDRPSGKKVGVVCKKCKNKEESEAKPKYYTGTVNFNYSFFKFDGYKKWKEILVFLF